MRTVGRNERRSGPRSNISEVIPFISPKISTALEPYVCLISDPIFAVIEKCLDNRAASCLVVDDDQHYLGRVTLDGLRKAVVAGNLNDSRDISRLVQPDTDDSGQSLIAHKDPQGKLVGVALNRDHCFVHIARPDLDHNEFRAVLDAFLSSWISSRGPHIENFERSFAKFLSLDHAIAVSNGTTALHLALLGVGIGPGDEVIVPDLTFAATINAVIHAGATPVLVDIDPQSWTLSIESVAAALTPRTKAIIPVHLYGRPAEMDGLLRLARSRGLRIIEDCAEAHGAAYNGTMVGAFGDVACFSFFANKLITTGEGGICATNCAETAAVIRELRDHGQAPGRYYWQNRVGYNYRMTNLQAAIGCQQLAKIDRTIARNLKLERRYRERLSGLPGIVFPPPLSAEFDPVIWLVSVLVPADKRAALMAQADRAGIEVRPFFNSLSEMPPYRKYARSCPHSLALSHRGLNLPTSAAVDATIIDRLGRVFETVLTE